MGKTTRLKSNAWVPGSSLESIAVPRATRILGAMAAVLVVLATQNLACRNHRDPGRLERSQEATSRKTNDKALKGSQTLDLSILQVRAMGRPRNEMRFYRGETIDCVMQISGFDAPKGRLHLLSTMTMTLPDKGILWKEGPKPLVNQPIPAGRSRKLVRLKMGLRLSTAEPAGKHRLLLRIDEPETQRYGTVALEFDVKGRKLRRPSRFSITAFDPPNPLDLRPGGALHLALWVGGFRMQPSAKGRFRLNIAGRITWRRTDDAASGTNTERHQEKTATSRHIGKTVGNAKKKDSDADMMSQPFQFAFEDLRFIPSQLPLLLTSRVPRKLGRYDITVTLWESVNAGNAGDTGNADNAGNAGSHQRTSTKARSSREVSRTVHRIPVQPAGLGIYDMQVLGLGNSPVHRFFRGQTMKVSFEVWTPEPKDLVGDLAVEGPDGGIYFVKKQAFRISKTGPHRQAHASRRILVPMELPRYCPVGQYRLLVRLRSRDGKQSASRQVSFIIEGRPLPPLPVLAITDWSLGNGRMLLPTLRQGQDTSIHVLVGGMHMDHSPPAGHRLDLVLNILLRDKNGHLLSKEPEAAHLSRTFTFQPRRVPLKATWRVPDNVSGLLLLQVEVEDLLTHKVTVSQKKILVQTN